MIKNYCINKKVTFVSSQEAFFQLTQSLSSIETMKMKHSIVENIIAIDGREVQRRLFEEHVNLRGLGDVGDYIIGNDKIVRTHKRIFKRTFISIFGKITITRMGYGARGSFSIFPKDAILNLPKESYSHGVRKLIAQEIAKNSFEEVLKTVKQVTGVSLPRTAIEQLTNKASRDFDSFYITQSEKSQENLPLLILTTDGKGIVMRREDLREATRKKAENRQHKFSKRRCKGEKANAKRMATVASVYSIDKFIRTADQIVGELHGTESSIVRPKPKSKRVWASIEKPSEKVIEDVFKEGLKRDPQNKKKWIFLIDGDPRQLKKIITIAKKTKVSVTIIMDIIHVIEYLWKAARIFYTETNHKTEKWVTDRLLAILHGKAGQVAGGIRRSATLKKISKKKSAPIEKCANYLLKNKNYLQYHNYLKEGFPIATGVIEGACRHLIKDRMDVTGARWSLKGAEAIVKLRSLRSSGDFEKYWEFHEVQEYERNHGSLYANPSILDKLK